ncbi:hypothetical protein EYZ11_011124 [Aspergillus tanneri]|uniref:Uncharacterized protein n=1 Tax=Aspergillus tanneri TaxID=1220188 RepID=A0A4S3J3K6_9EURO|nr:hypothetical protein EYZ11_011124 [Aspergillus tanneri]
MLGDALEHSPEPDEPTTYWGLESLTRRRQGGARSLKAGSTTFSEADGDTCQTDRSSSDQARPFVTTFRAWTMVISNIPLWNSII